MGKEYTNIAELIKEGHFAMAQMIIRDRLDVLKEWKLHQVKRMIGAAAYVSEEEEFEIENLTEAPRVRIVKARVRQGKVQRRKKVSNVKGYTFRQGALKRMSPVERRNRKLGQRKGKIKRRAKINIALRKRARSMRKRTSIGLDR